MIDMPSAVAFWSSAETGALGPDGVSSSGGVVGDDSDAHAAANSSDDHANLRDQTIH
jgi:hypothetical protein